MAEKISVSFRDEDSELLEWVDDKVEDGVFRSRSHAICYAVKNLKEDSVDDVIV